MATRPEFDRQDATLILRAVLGVAVSVVAVAVIPLSVFLKPLNAEFGWGRGEIALAVTAMALSMAAAMPVAGLLIDRFGITRPAIVSLLAYAGGLLCLPLIMSHFGLAGLYAGACWIGAAGSASSSVVYVKILSALFDRSRGLALGIAMSGMPLGAAIAPLIAVSLVELYGWQAGFYGLAALPIVVGIPIILSLRTVAARAAGAASSSEKRAVGVLEAMRTRTFGMLFIIFLIAATALHGIQIHLPSLLSDRGLSAQLSVAAMSAMFMVSLLARIGAGYLFDRWFAPWVGSICFLGSAIGAVMMLAGDVSALTVIAAIVLLAIGTGAETDLLALLVSRYFGARSFAGIYGSIFGAFMIGSAIGPYVVGMAFDNSGNYVTALGWSAGGLLCAAILLVTLPRFAVAAARSDDKVVSPA